VLLMLTGWLERREREAVACLIEAQRTAFSEYACGSYGRAHGLLRQLVMHSAESHMKSGAMLRIM
jgi:hypothetical protein